MICKDLSDMIFALFLLKEFEISCDLNKIHYILDVSAKSNKHCFRDVFLRQSF